MRIFGYDIKKRPRAGEGTPQKTLCTARPAVVSYYEPSGVPFYDFARSEILDALRMISSRLSNIRWSAEVPFMAAQKLTAFLSEDYLELIRRLFYDGYLVVGVHPAPHLVSIKNRAVRRTTEGVFQIPLEAGEVLLPSLTFRATGHSDEWYLRDKLHFLNTINNSDLNLIENYGAMGVLSPETDNSVAGAFFDEKEVEEMHERYRRTYGLKLGRWQVMITPRPTRWNAIELPIGALQLSQKRLYTLQAIYTALGIPKELSTYFENAKYENRNAAELDFYSSTIKSYGVLFTKLLKDLWRETARDNPGLPRRLEFWFDFEGVPAMAEKKRELEASAREMYLFWQQVRDTDPENADTARLRIKDIIENL